MLAIAGDDPSCKSSSLCSQSEPMLFHVGIPSLYPGNVQEILDYGLHGYQMSRLGGLWVGMFLKIITHMEVDTPASIKLARFAAAQATYEGMDAHRHAAAIRLDDLGKQ